MEQIPKARRLPEAERARVGAELKARYETGVSVRALAAEMGRSYGFTHLLLTEAGVTWRPRGGAMRRRVD